ncbi:hypothetical protein [Aquimarina sp. 2201CG14-23]|uniref:hypothetical protein n=1 Tax=Aquimarina mycalae TaxID=3040073 RepID=UPI00247816CB|nr:hypothetical protein [Aquimarina sp. 2201CG14-23]MDH7446847.1 hypothetical protein [Aquimarina sp. 2201CG14-23]
MKLKKIISLLLIVGGAVLLISEIGASQKNYYLQSVGIVCLMSGLFLINTSLLSRSNEQSVDVSRKESLEEEE